jgi:phasin family protein
MWFPFMFDMAALLAAQRRNMDAIVAAGSAVREGAQAVAQRNLEIIQQAFDGFADRMQTMGIEECPKARAMRQTEAAIKACEDAADIPRELGEMIQHAQAEAMEILSKRFTEAADEVKSLARDATRRFWETEEKPATFWYQT